MNWQLLGLSFILVFVSELGDKSQLVAITLGGNSRSTTLAFLGVAAGLVLTSFLGVLLGDQVAQLLPTAVLKAIAALSFALLGVYLLWPRPGVFTISSPNAVIETQELDDPSPGLVDRLEKKSP